MKALFRTETDMTKGVPWKEIVLFSLPLLVGNIIQQLYTTVDSLVVGRYVGRDALAAVGTSFPIQMLFLALFMGISSGAGVMISQYYGARQDDMLKRTMHTTLTLTFFMSIAVTVLGYFLSPVILRALQTPPEVFDRANAYLQILFIGTIGSLYYNMLSGVLRGVGDSITPLIFLAIACGLNILLDLLFVAVFHMDVAGAAWATIIAQLISAIFAFLRIQRMGTTLRVHAKELKVDRGIAKNIIKLGLPAGAQQALFSFATLIVQSLINGFGPTVMAGCNIAMRVDSFAMLPNFTFGIAMTTYAGQNIGAKRLDRVEEGTREGLRLAVIISLSLTVLLILFGGFMMRMFIDDIAVVDAGMRMIYFIAAGYVCVAINQVLSGVMRGSGDTLVPMLNALLTTCVVRLPVAYALKYFLGTADCIYISLLCAWVIGAVHIVWYYRRGSWKTKAIV